MYHKIVSDSSSDIKELSGVPYESVPLKIITDEKEYVDDKDVDVVEMLSDLKKYSGRSRSSCPNSEEYMRAFSDAKNIFVVTITSNLSGSYNSAVIAAKAYMNQFPDRNVHIIDSLSTGPECALIIEKLRSLMVENYEFEDVKQKITEYHEHTRLLIALENMHNLANNGRVSPIVAKMAGLLGIRAIGRASDQGTLEMICKSRGPHNTALDILKNMIDEGYNGGKCKIHHANNLPAAELLWSMITEKFPDAKVDVSMTGALCSFYAEQGGILVGFEV